MTRVEFGSALLAVIGSAYDRLSSEDGELVARAEFHLEAETPPPDGWGPEDIWDWLASEDAKVAWPPPPPMSDEEYARRSAHVERQLLLARRRQSMVN